MQPKPASERRAAVLLFAVAQTEGAGRQMARKIRVLVGKPGLDGHDRGAKVVAAALRDAGMEVIYTGLHQSPEQIVEAAIQEDVDVVALSILSGAHMTQFPAVAQLMRERGLGDRLLTGGGIIPPEDMASLAKSGVGRLFGPGTSTQDIAAYVRGWFAQTHGEDGGAAKRASKTAPPKPAAKRAVAKPAAKRATAKPTARRATARAASKRAAPKLRARAKVARPNGQVRTRAKRARSKRG
jgi:methylmalonyl-CoA mutase C-terminal domain/subunit